MSAHNLLDKALEESRVARESNGAIPAPSSQSIVDELFKDFISSKISKTGDGSGNSSKNKSNNNSSKSKTKSIKIKSSSHKVSKSKTSNVDEISKLLDMEINSIRAQTKDINQPPREPAPLLSSIPIPIPPQTQQKQQLTAPSKERDKVESVEPISISAYTVPLPPPPAPAHIPLPPKVSAVQSKPHIPLPSQKDTSPVIVTLASTTPTISISIKPKLTISSFHSSTTTTSSTTSLSKTVVKTTSPSLPLSIVPSSTTILTTSSATTSPFTSFGSSTFTTSTKPIGSLAFTKKLNIPKQLGCKLSEQSLSLIKSKDKVDKHGRVWEDGEVNSSHSEDSNQEDSDSDEDEGGGPSDTGSIHSEKDWKSESPSSKHKKKHKHKHKKKKKKKSSKESKDKSEDGEKDDKGSKKEKDKSSHSSSSKDKDKKSDDSVTTGKEDKGSEGEKKSTEDKDKSELKRKDKKRKHDRSRSRTPKKSKRSRSRSRSPKRSRKSPSPRRSRYGEWDARRYSDKRSRSRSPHKRRRSSDRKRDRSSERKRDRSSDRKRDRSSDRKRDRFSDRKKDDKSPDRKTVKEKAEIDLRLQIDKTKLRKIAIANTLSTMKAGHSVPVPVDMTVTKAGGKSVEELTNFCKRISEKEKEKKENGVSDSSEEEPMPPSDEEDSLIHHPFKVKEASANIVMNIRNAKQLPVMTPSEKQVQQASLRLSFPVSSGTTHRASESEWVPVEKTTAAVTTPTNNWTTSQSQASTSSSSKPEPEVEKPKSIFPSAAAPKVDIGTIISERLSAVRKLQENPYDVQALSSMHKAQQKASQWAQSKHLPGQFTGSTGAHVMSQSEIIGDKRRQAWVKKTQFSSAAPVNGIGMLLLQKMGWKQGEGLGKNQEGNTQPLQLDIKIDRKGLTTAADKPQARQFNNRPQAARPQMPRDLSHKHPVSALMELCNKRRWGPPSFNVVTDEGPAHKKCFIYKVNVNNVEYQPAVPSANKKSAKAQCAAVCLQELGLLSKDAPMNY